MKKQMFLSCGAALTLSAAAFGSIISTGGSAELIAAPADARLNALTSSTAVRVWNEQQLVTLTSGLTVNASLSGLYNGPADLANSVVPAGTVISSHYVHFDSPAGTSANATGSIRFDGDIIGVICVGDSGTDRFLDASDFLSSGTLYGDGIEARGMELSNNEFFRISNDRRGIEFSMRISNPGDFIRVVTVPAPSVAALGGLGVAFASRRRRR